MPDVFVSESKKIVSDKPVDSIPTEIPQTEAKRVIVPGHTHNRMGSFCLYPEDVDFETREKEEKIILVLRAHPIINVKWILVTLLMFFVPGVVGVFGFLSTLPTGFDLVITLAWYLVTLAYALENFLDWYFNIYIVTDTRIVDVNFTNLIYKEVSDADLDKIQDVSYHMGGVIRTIFNYGDVFIQTAAEVSEFDFLAVPDPARVTKIIDELKMKEEIE